MTRILRTYARRYRFAHPTSEDFIAVVNEVTGPGLPLVLRPDLVLERAVRLRGDGAERRRRATLEGYRGRAGRAARAGPAPRAARTAGRSGPFESEVTVRRLGGVRLPVEVLVEFADGRVDARGLGRPVPLDALPLPGRGARSRRAVVDPERQDRPRREPRQQLLGGREGRTPAAPPRSGRRAGCSGSRTCWSCTRCWDEAAGDTRCATGLRRGRRAAGGWRAPPRCVNLLTAALLAVPLAAHAGAPTSRRPTSAPAMIYGFDYPWWSHWSDAQPGWPATLRAPTSSGAGFAFKNVDLLLKGAAPRRACSRCSDAGRGDESGPRCSTRHPGPRGRLPRSCRSSWPAACCRVLRAAQPGTGRCAGCCTAPASTSAAWCASALLVLLVDCLLFAAQRALRRAGRTARRARRSPSAPPWPGCSAATRCCCWRCCLVHLVSGYARVIIVLEERSSAVLAFALRGGLLRAGTCCASAATTSWWSARACSLLAALERAGPAWDTSGYKTQIVTFLLLPGAGASAASFLRARRSWAGSSTLLPAAPRRGDAMTRSPWTPRASGEALGAVRRPA